MEFILRVLHKAEIVFFLDRCLVAETASASRLLIVFVCVDATTRVRVILTRCEDALSVGHHHSVSS